LPAIKEAIGRVIPVETLRYVAFSHVEADECGTLNQFLAVAPNAVPVCSRTAAMVSINDMADRAAARARRRRDAPARPPRSSSGTTRRTSPMAGSPDS
jgi:hypothetical protein